MTAALSREQARTEFLIDILGSGSALAELLGVNRSQPSRWRKGQDRPGPVVARQLIDLEHVLERALLLWTPRVTQAWLTGSNAYLGGARPLDVLLSRGPTEVLDALGAVEAGAFS